MRRLARRSVSALVLLSSLLFVATAAWSVSGLRKLSTTRITRSGQMFGWEATDFAMEFRSAALGPDVFVVPDVSVVRFLGLEYAAGHAVGAPGGAPEYRLFVIPCAYPLILTGLSPAAWLATEWRRHARRNAAAGLCPHCAYDVRATPGRCPECGAASASPP
jgi:hypothetical protein